jgi:hypothetical protein
MRAVLAVAAVALVILSAPFSIDAAPPAPSVAAWGREAVRADTKTACVYTRNDLRLLAKFQRRVGRAFSCALVFNDAAPGWKGWIEPWVQVHPDPRFRWADWVAARPGRRLVLTQSLVPASVPADWRRRGARGEYDRYARALARNLIRKGLGDTVIRLSHEMNGDWYRDNIGDTVREHRDWARYWARVVRVMRRQPGAHFVFDWNIAAGYRAIPFERYYPGDGVVDIVGIDFYDYRFTRDVPARPGAGRWRRQFTQPGGLGEAIAFAKAHGKPISLPEWGLAKPGRYRGGLGDNPDFVRRIARLVRTTPTVYQAYFESPTGDTKQLKDAPRSRAVYRGSLLSRTPR